MAGIRHKARTAAMQVICILTLRESVLTDDVEAAIVTIKKESFPQENENDFFRDLIFGVVKHRTAIDEQIEKFAPKFPVKNLSAVDRAIIEVGLYEMMHTDTPTPIIINEAVEIAKAFGDEGTPRFINGVLSSQDKENNK